LTQNKLRFREYSRSQIECDIRIIRNFIPEIKTKIMNAIQLKQELIHRISRIDDLDFLNAIKTILDYKKKEIFIELTDDQEKELLLTSKEAKKGDVISQSEMDQKVEEWLREK